MHRIARAYLVRFRRELAAALTGITVLIGINALSPLHSTRIVTAARSLPSGQVLRTTDLRIEASTVSWAGAFSDASELVGRTTSHSLAAGEPLTAASIMGPSLLNGQVPGRVAVALPIDSGDATLIHPGDVVDVLSTSERVATAASVIAISAAANRALTGSSSTTAIVAVYPHEAESIAAGRASGSFMLALLAR